MKQVKLLVEQIANIKGYAISKDDALNKGLQSYIEVEYSNAYGGYRVVMVRVEGGGHFGALGESSICPRRSKSKMIAFLQGYLNALN